MIININQTYYWLSPIMLSIDYYQSTSKINDLKNLRTYLRVRGQCIIEYEEIVLSTLKLRACWENHTLVSRIVVLCN